MVLHLANDYSGSTVYKNLIFELDSLCVPQTIYTPIRDIDLLNKNKIDLYVEESKIIYSMILNSYWDRILYRKKIKKIVRDIESKVDLTNIRFIHAHTWYSDGGVAYLLSKKYNIPYIVTIRNTDINLFQKYFIHERRFGRKILFNARNIVLISASYKQRVIGENSLRTIQNILNEKLLIIPNGVDSYWIENAVIKKVEENKKQFNCLFIGKFTNSKNVEALQSAVRQLYNEGKNIHLHLVGGGGKSHHNVLMKVDLNANIMTYHGKVDDFGELKKHFENADIFAMPSKHETFGLVYVEAMLQGLPIIYTENEGIDGFYEENIGEKVRVSETDEIREKLLFMIENYNSYIIPIEKLKENHNWRDIAKKYSELYNL